MQLHDIIQDNPPRKSRRIGRGGKRGTYSGRGIKGMGARAGAKYRPQERDIIKRIPKNRGYKFRSFQTKPTVVNLDRIMKSFLAGDEISPETLYKKGIISRPSGALPKVKILGHGEMTKSFVFKNVLFSKSAAKKAGIESSPTSAAPEKKAPKVASEEKKKAPVKKKHIQKKLK